MNSFKKISIGVVAAISIGTLVATPASAATTTLTVNGSSVSGTVATAPISVTVPADNSVDAADAVKVAVTGLDTGTTVSASATNASIVPALATVAAPVTASAGAATIAVNTGTGTTAEFYVFTKSAAGSSFVVTIGGNTSTFYLKGTAGPAYVLTVAGADSVNTSSVAKVYAKTTDVFGNPVITTVPTISTVGVTAGTVSVSDTATGTFVADLTFGSTVGQAAYSVTIAATDVTAFGPATKTVSKFVAISDMAAELAKVKAELASVKATAAADKAAADKAAADAATAAKAAADLAAAAYKAEYNALATKWNKAHPKAKVALKK